MIDDLEKEMKAFFMEKGRSDLFELTYAYTIQNDRFFNRTLFAEYGSGQMNDLPEKLISSVRVKLEEDIVTLHSLIDCFGNEDARRTTLHVKTLNYTQRIYEMIWRSIPFEVQKRYPEDRYDEYELEECRQKIEQLDREIFGQLVSEKSREVSRSEYVLQEVYSSNYARLSHKDGQRYVQYVSLLHTLPHYKKEICLIEMSSSYLDHDIFSALIPREIYIELFSLVFDFYNLKVPVKVDERNSIYDGYDALYIPNSDAYECLSLRKVLDLIAHEIETHYIVLHNTDQLLGGIKGSNNLPREEGLATLQEFLLTGKELSDIDMSSNIPIILFGELLTGAEYLDFLSLYFSLRGNESMVIDRLLRAKRSYPLRGIGVQHKDVAYRRGVYAVRNYLVNGGNFTDLFLAKVSFEDIKLLVQHANKNKIIFPKQVTMRVVFTLLSGGDQKKYENFIQQSIKTYPFIQQLLLTPFTEYEQQIFESLVMKIKLTGVTDGAQDSLKKCN